MFVRRLDIVSRVPMAMLARIECTLSRIGPTSDRSCNHVPLTDPRSWTGTLAARFRLHPRLAVGWLRMLPGNMRILSGSPAHSRSPPALSRVAGSGSHHRPPIAPGSQRKRRCGSLFVAASLQYLPSRKPISHNERIMASSGCTWRLSLPSKHRLPHPERGSVLCCRAHLTFRQLSVRLRAVANLQKPFHGRAWVVAMKGKCLPRALPGNPSREAERALPRPARAASFPHHLEARSRRQCMSSTLCISPGARVRVAQPRPRSRSSSPLSPSSGPRLAFDMASATVAASGEGLFVSALFPCSRLHSLCASPRRSRRPRQRPHQTVARTLPPESFLSGMRRSPVGCASTKRSSESFALSPSTVSWMETSASSLEPVCKLRILSLIAARPWTRVETSHEEVSFLLPCQSLPGLFSTRPCRKRNSGFGCPRKKKKFIKGGARHASLHVERARTTRARVFTWACTSCPEASRGTQENDAAKRTFWATIGCLPWARTSRCCC